MRKAPEGQDRGKVRIGFVTKNQSTAERKPVSMPDVPIILFTHHADALLRIELIVDRVVAKGDAHALMAHVRALAPSDGV